MVQQNQMPSPAKNCLTQIAIFDKHYCTIFLNISNQQQHKTTMNGNNTALAKTISTDENNKLGGQHWQGALNYDIHV